MNFGETAKSIDHGVLNSFSPFPNTVARHQRNQRPNEPSINQLLQYPNIKRPNFQPREVMNFFKLTDWPTTNSGSGKIQTGLNLLEPKDKRAMGNLPKSIAFNQNRFDSN